MNPEIMVSIRLNDFETYTYRMKLSKKVLSIASTPLDTPSLDGSVIKAVEASCCDTQESITHVRNARSFFCHEVADEINKKLLTLLSSGDRVNGKLVEK